MLFDSFSTLHNARQCMQLNNVFVRTVRLTGVVGFLLLTVPKPLAD